MHLVVSSRFVAVLAFLLMAGMLAACGGAQPAPTTAPADLSPAETEPATAEAEIVTLYVGPSLVDCTGVAPMQCMQVKRTPEGEYELFYAPIEGFEYEEGYEYELLVEVTQVENAPSDGSSLKYTLVEVVSKTPAPREATAEATGDPLTGTEWMLASYANPAGETMGVLPGSEITAQFEDGRIGGRSPR